MKKRIVAIGGGEIKNKTTIEIDRVVAGLIKERANGGRGCALFLGTASHDSMPYFNSFRKTYTSVFDIKAEVGLLVYGEMDEANIKAKFEKADCVYVGGGDTKFMLDLWKEKGIDKLLFDAYDRGVILCGLSAGAVCWFQNAYTDYDIMRGQSSEYKVLPALGLLEGIACPHYDERPEFDAVAQSFETAYAIGNDSAVIFEDGKPVRFIGNAKMLKGQSRGQANVQSNGQANEQANVQSNGQSNEKSRGQTNVQSNGQSNEKSRGQI